MTLLALAACASPVAAVRPASPVSPVVLVAGPSETPRIDAPPPPPPARVCGNGGWTTYGHDAARTSAADGCLEPPLRQAWRFVPETVQGRKSHIHHAVADGDSVFAVGLRGESPMA